MFSLMKVGRKDGDGLFTLFQHKKPPASCRRLFRTLKMVEGKKLIPKT